MEQGEMSKFEVGQIVYVCQITSEDIYDQFYDGTAIVSAINSKHVVLRYVDGYMAGKESTFSFDNKRFHISEKDDVYMEKMERIQKWWKEHNKKKKAEKEREEEMRKANEAIKKLWPWWRLW